MTSIPSWLPFAVGSAFFAGLTAILGKLGVATMNSNVATLIRTVVILIMIAGIISARGEWRFADEVDLRSSRFLVLSCIATGLSWLC